MPRAIDPSLPAGGLPIDHDPLSRIPFNPIPHELDLAAVLESVFDTLLDQIRDFLFPAILELTGIDLSVFLPLLDLLELDFSTPAAFLNSLWEALMALPGLIIPGLQSLTDTIFQALTGSLDIGVLLESVFDALQNIPFLNVLGLGGPSNIGQTVQETWDNLISGLVGVLGGGSGLADIFNVAQEVSSRATLGLFSWDILGIRNNKSLLSGFFPTSQSSIGLDKVALAPTAPTFPLTQSTAITAFHRINENGNKALVTWMGSGVTNITAAFVNVWKMDPLTGIKTLVHASDNIVGNLSAALQTNVYELPTPIPTLAGEVYGTEVAIRGTGTHNVVGSSTWLPDQPVYPKRFSAVRNSGTSAPPSTITTPTYATNVPFMEFGVSAGDVSIPHSPQLFTFNIIGSTTIPIPSWCNKVEVVAVGSGGGGRQGQVGSDGNGGLPGSWATDTWDRGTEFTGATIITVNVAAGGAGGPPVVGGVGASGGVNAAGIAGHTVIAAGGAGATGGNILGDHSGHGPGNQTYGGQLYVGGGGASNYSNDGAAPGGGGAGGSGTFGGAGGNGATGSVWIRFIQGTPPPPSGTSAFPYTLPIILT